MGNAPPTSAIIAPTNADDALKIATKIDMSLARSRTDSQSSLLTADTGYDTSIQISDDDSNDDINDEFNKAHVSPGSNDTGLTMDDIDIGSLSFSIDLDNDIKTDDEILAQFEYYCMNKSTIKAITIMENYHYNHINFFEYFFKNGDTCLHYSVRIKNYGFTYYLLNKCGNLNIKNQKDGDTPIHIAIKNNDVKTAQTLIKFDCNIKIKNRKKERPLDIAIMNSNKDLIDILLIQQKAIFDEYQKNKRQSQLHKKPRISHFSKHHSSSVIKKARNELIILDDYYSDESVSDEEIVNDYSIEHNISNASNDNDIMNGNNNDTPIMCDWLEKLNGDIYSHKYIKVFVFIQDGYLIWNDHEVKFNPTDKLSMNLKDKFSGCISLSMIKNVSIVESKLNNLYKFKITYKHGYKSLVNDEFIYLWKCSTIHQRNKWIKYINNCTNNI